MQLEDKLCHLHQKEYSYVVGNATIGIYLILKALGISNKRIALPNNICFNVPFAILFSDNIPVFLDSSSDDLGLSIAGLKKNKNNIDIVLTNHAYGSICNIDEIVSFCRNNNKFIIEDFAVAQGAKLHNIPVGSFGDVSIVSFGAGKIISINHGGAILSNDIKIIKEIKAVEKTFPQYSVRMGNDIAFLAQNIRNLYNQYYGTEYWKHEINFYDIAKEFKSSFFFKFSRKYETILLEKLTNLPNNIMKRNAKAEILSKLFQEENSENINIFTPSDGSVYWRFNIFVKKNRNELLKYLLKKKYPISSWYPSVNVLFDRRLEMNGNKIQTPHSDKVGDEIINIWVNEEVDNNYLENIVKEIANKYRNLQKNTSPAQ